VLRLTFGLDKNYVKSGTLYCIKAQWACLPACARIPSSSSVTAKDADRPVHPGVLEKRARADAIRLGAPGTGTSLSGAWFLFSDSTREAFMSTGDPNQGTGTWARWQRSKAAS
jgi:hypothetical protein